MKKSIVFVGFMSCGKSTICKTIAQNLDLEYFDTDKIISNSYGISVSDIFNKYGQDKFAETELDVIKNIIDKKCMVSVGGSAFIREQTFNLIKQKSLSVYIKVSPKVIYKRIKQNNGYKNRPNIISIFELQEESLIIKGIKDMLKQREGWYNQADVVIKINGNEAVKHSINKAMIALKEYF